MAETIRDLLQPHAADAAAILAPERPGLRFGALRELADATVARLNALGIGRGDRVAIVLPNGPEMATSFISVACGATTAPLNPAYRAEELDFYLSDLRAKALIVADGDKGPAVEVARRHKAEILRLTTSPDRPAGWFELAAEGSGDAPVATGAAQEDDEALVLHTSGTTSRPKIVPLLQRNLAASARHIRTTLALTPADRCLNVMPLFHIHGPAPRRRTTRRWCCTPPAPPPGRRSCPCSSAISPPRRATSAPPWR